MALLLSSQDVAIALAIKAGTIRVAAHVSARLGNTYYAIEDAHGVIAVELSRVVAEDRVALVRRRAVPCSGAHRPGACIACDFALETGGAS